MLIPIKIHILNIANKMNISPSLIYRATRKKPDTHLLKKDELI